MENNTSLLPLKATDSFDDIFKRHQFVAITKWPIGTADAALIHLEREVEELKMALIAEHRDAQLLEYVDCLLCLFTSMTRAGFSIDEIKKAMAIKVNINYVREWKYNGDGTYSHIKTPEPEQTKYPNGNTLP